MRKSITYERIGIQYTPIPKNQAAIASTGSKSIISNESRDFYGALL